MGHQVSALARSEGENIQIWSTSIFGSW